MKEKTKGMSEKRSKSIQTHMWRRKNISDLSVREAVSCDLVTSGQNHPIQNYKAFAISTSRGKSLSKLAMQQHVIVPVVGHDLRLKG